MMTFLFEAEVNDVAQVIVALAVFLVACRGMVWAFRCPSDSKNYKLPNIQIGLWKERQRDD